MSNAKRLALAPESFVGLLEKLGARVTEQSGFFRVDGPEGRRLYVGKGRITTTVHLSGFTLDEGTRVLVKSPSKMVEQEMDWPDGIDAIGQLRLFAEIYNKMMALPPRAKEAKKEASKGTPVQPLVVDPSLVLNALPMANADEAA